MSAKLQFLYIVFISLSSLILAGINTSKPDINAKEIREAYKGNQEAQISLANFYCKENQSKMAVIWYEKAIQIEVFEFQNEILSEYLRSGNDFFKNKCVRKDTLYKLIDKYQRWAKAGDIKAQKLLIDLSLRKQTLQSGYIKSLHKKWKDHPYIMFDKILDNNNLELGKDNKKIIQLFNELALKNKNIEYKCELWSKGIYDKRQKKTCPNSTFETAVLNECPDSLLFYGYMLLDNSDIKCYKEYRKLAIFPSGEKEKKKKAIEAFEKLSRRKWNSIGPWTFVASGFSHRFNKDNFRLEKYDFNSAIKWYKKAYALGNDPRIAYEIGMLYKEGDKTLTKNYPKAVKWFYKSAVQNYMPAQMEIGYLYSKGLGVKKNQTLAIKWLKRAYSHNSFFCSVCYKTELMLNNLGFVNFFNNIKQIYEF